MCPQLRQSRTQQIAIRIRPRTDRLRLKPLLRIGGRHFTWYDRIQIFLQQNLIHQKKSLLCPADLQISAVERRSLTAAYGQKPDLTGICRIFHLQHSLFHIRRIRLQTKLPACRQLLRHLRSVHRISKLQLLRGG